MEINIQKFINDLPAGCKDGKIIQQAIFSELCKMLDPGKSGPVHQRSECSVVMLIGLHGCEKETVCVKYARYHRRMSFKPALVCADTFTPGALDRLNHVAAKAKVPVYGSYTELNPAKVAMKGIEKFKSKNRDLIIVDTNSRHKQYYSLFEEMSQIAKIMKPNLVILVMDSRIGQAASVEAKAFKQSFHAGSVILTNIRGNTKASGALSSLVFT
ncbi:signal recognition particle 54 kDa protein 3 [Eutrema salsugineum]|uniref:signal recognition particle 54 kDa protein 3 n=1 Tax=Eutrema salsugineum TaxID=72664 RepID=UPI000CECEF0F|nr:signal recognition particle 54 kDa protein 3 [Eutrema salsugineum]